MQSTVFNDVETHVKRGLEYLFKKATLSVLSIPRLFKAVRSPPLETLPTGQPGRVGRSETQCSPKD